MSERTIEREREIDKKSAAGHREYVEIFVKDYDNFCRAPPSWEDARLYARRENGFTYIIGWKFDEGEPPLPIANTWGDGGG